jgi:hypothetical protein
VETELGIIEHVERGVDLLIVRRAAQAKEPLAAIEPGKRVTLAVELGKL